MGSENSKTQMDVESVIDSDKVTVAPLPRTKNYHYYCGSSADSRTKSELLKINSLKNKIDKDKTVERDDQRRSRSSGNEPESQGSREKEEENRIQDIVNRTLSDPIITYRLGNRDSQSEESPSENEELRRMVSDILEKVIDERLVRSERMRKRGVNEGIARVEKTDTVEGTQMPVNMDQEIDAKRREKSCL